MRHPLSIEDLETRLRDYYHAEAASVSADGSLWDRIAPGLDTPPRSNTAVQQILPEGKETAAASDPERRRAAGRTPSFPLLGRAFNLAGLAAFVAIIGLITVGLAVMLPRMRGGQSIGQPGAGRGAGCEEGTTAGYISKEEAIRSGADCASPIADIRPTAVALYVPGREPIRLQPGSPEFDRYASAAERRLRDLGTELRACGHCKQGQAEALHELGGTLVELTYAKPGIRLGDHGPYSRVLIEVEHTRKEPNESYDVYLGNERYTHQDGKGMSPGLAQINELLRVQPEMVRVAPTAPLPPYPTAVPATSDGDVATPTPTDTSAPD